MMTRAILLMVGLWVASHVLLADDPATTAVAPVVPAEPTDPSAAEASRAAQVDDFIKQGRTAMFQRDFPMAIADFTNAVELQRYEPKGFFYRGMAYSRSGDYDHAIADFNRVILLNPKSANGYALRAEAYAGKGNREAAQADLDKAAALPPNQGQTAVICARVEQRLGRFDKAREDLTKAVQLDPTNWLLCNNLAWRLATCPDASVRDGKKAVEVATQGMQLLKQSHWPPLTDTLACAYAEAGDFDNAVKFENQFLAELQIGADDSRNKLPLFQAKKAYRETMEEAMKGVPLKARGAPKPGTPPIPGGVQDAE